MSIKAVNGEKNLTIEELMKPENLSQFVDEAAKKNKLKISNEEKADIINKLTETVSNGVPAGKVFNLSKEQIVQIYTFAMKELKAGHFNNACELFKILVTLMPDELSFYIGLGVCHQRMKRYDEAICVFITASVRDETNPIALYYAYDCLMKKGNVIGAQAILNEVIRISKGQPIYKHIEEKSKLLLASVEKDVEALKKQIEEDLKKIIPRVTKEMTMKNPGLS